MSHAPPVISAARIPRGTCKLFGAIKALGIIKNSVILVHGPKGCVYHINYILGMRGDRPSEIYTTSLDEHDVIFGAEQKLKEAIGYLDITLQPELLFVLSCCTSDIIGEDVASAVRETMTQARTIAISAGGFEGDFHEGYSETLCQLARELVKKPGITASRERQSGRYAAGRPRSRRTQAPARPDWCEGKCRPHRGCNTRGSGTARRSRTQYRAL